MLQTIIEEKNQKEFVCKRMMMPNNNEIEKTTFRLNNDDSNSASLTNAGISSIRGESNSAVKGSEFEDHANNKIFKGESQRLMIDPIHNKHLDDYGDGVGITNDYRRITDGYLPEDGSIWEYKAGYAKSVVDLDQLEEYRIMEDAGFVNVVDGKEIVKVPVNSINYLFDSRKGAAFNASYLKGKADVWYLDENQDIQLYQAD